MTPNKLRGGLTAVLAVACLFAQAQNRTLGEKGQPDDMRRKAALKQAEWAKKEQKAARDERDQMRRDRAMVRSLIQDLVSDGLIRCENDALSVELTSRSLVVNGQLEPTEVWDRFRNKYIRDPEAGIFFGEVRGVGKGLFMKKEDLREEY